MVAIMSEEITIVDAAGLEVVTVIKKKVRVVEDQSSGKAIGFKTVNNLERLAKRRLPRRQTLASGEYDGSQVAIKGEALPLIFKNGSS